MNIHGERSGLSTVCVCSCSFFLVFTANKMNKNSLKETKNVEIFNSLQYESGIILSNIIKPECFVTLYSRLTDFTKVAASFSLSASLDTLLPYEKYRGCYDNASFKLGEPFCIIVHPKLSPGHKYL